MITKKVNKLNLIIHDSIEQLPAVSFQKYNRYLMIDAGIGSDANSFDQRINTLYKLIKQSPDKAILELSNLQQCVHFMIQNVSPRMNSFVCLIHSIDGVKLSSDDLTDEGIRAILARLSKDGWTMRMINKVLDAVKKKWMKK